MIRNITDAEYAMENARNNPAKTVSIDAKEIRCPHCRSTPWGTYGVSGPFQRILHVTGFAKMKSGREWVEFFCSNCEGKFWSAHPFGCRMLREKITDNIERTKPWNTLHSSK